MAAMTCSTRWLTGAVEPTHGHDAAAALAPVSRGLTAGLSPPKTTPVTAKTIRARLRGAPERQMDEVLVVDLCPPLVTNFG